jgi:hypothetical protein
VRVPPKIISVSRRTDIPAFYGSWFMNRLSEGYAGFINPYNKQPHKVSLSRKDVIAFIFWTKNVTPFLESLNVIERNDYPFYLHYTITSYNELLEPSVPALQDSIASAALFAERFGKERLIWRYDPIIISQNTPVEYHVEQFSRIAKILGRYTSSCHTGFLNHYKKVTVSLTDLNKRYGFQVIDQSPSEQANLLSQLAETANSHGIALHCCSEPADSLAMVKRGSCIDLERIHRLFYQYSIPPKVPRAPSRKECNCFQATDIGAYNSCLHDCVYCYANSDQVIRNSLFQDHDPSSPILGLSAIDGRKSMTDIENRRLKNREKERSLFLFE